MRRKAKNDRENRENNDTYVDTNNINIINNKAKKEHEFAAQEMEDYRQLKLFEEKLFHPKFDEKDFKRVKKQFKENLAQQKIEPNYAAGVTANSILYGNSVWGLHPTKRNIEKIELEDVKNYYNKYYAPELASLIVVGNVDQKDIEPKLAFLNQWKPKGLSIHA